MGNEFDIKSINENSSKLNTQPGHGGQKPTTSGQANPGDTKPPRDVGGTVPMPK